MEQYIIFIVIVVLLLVVLVASIWYFKRQARLEAYDLQSMTGTLEPVDQHLPTEDRVWIEDTPVTPIRCIQFEGSNLVLGARPLSSRQALVAFGEIPQGMAYWGWDAYCYQIQQRQVWTSFGDPVSSSNVRCLTPGDGVAVVLTCNPLLYREIASDIQLLWSQGHGRHPITIVPIYIPKAIYTTEASYTLINRCVLAHGVSPPDFETRLYWSTNIPIRSTEPIKLRPRSTAPKEQDTLSLGIWYETAANSVRKKNLKLRREISTAPWLAELIPNGLDKGLDCFPNRQGRGHTRDITRNFSAEINLTPEESIVVVAVDHVMSSRSTYSNVAFYDLDSGKGYAVYTTGDSTQRKRNRNGTTAVRMITNNPAPNHFKSGVARIQVVESCYPEQYSGLGPDYSSILPFRVFVVDRVAL